MRFNFTVGVAVGLCWAGIALAQVSSTRDSDYDWRCTDAQGNRISDHQRYDTALIACLNALNGAYVQGGRYRITKGTTTPTPPPQPTTGSATLSWTPPTTNIDGTTITNLAGYRISYGTSSTALTQTIQVAVPGATAYTISNLAPGNWYFSVRAYTSNGTESDQSAVRNKVIM